MKSHLQSTRLAALDGLRGFAILMVFLSHIGLSVHSGSINPTIYNLLFVSGGIGVAFLFILSGFLMGYLYSRPNNIGTFLQKRYTRIFPLFLTVSFAQFLFRFWANNIMFQVLILLSVAVLVHILWVYGIKKLSYNQKRIFFFVFIVLQVVVGITYFITSQNILHVSLPYLSHSFSLFLTWLVNATLTFPFGSSFPLLDRVYWSLATEIFFYILYPTVCAPIMIHLSTKSRLTKLFLLIALIPFFFGLARLTERIGSFNIIHLDYFYNFVGGMTLAYIYKKYRSNLISFHKRFSTVLYSGSIIIFIVVFLLSHISTTLLNGFLEQIILTIPYTIILALLLLPTNGLVKIFSHRILTFVGLVSYSMYVSHTWIIYLTGKVIVTTSTIEQIILFVCISLFLSVLLASLLYYLLEKPYFIREKSKSINVPEIAPIFTLINPFYSFSIVIALYMFAILFAYKIDLPYNHLRDPYLNKTISLTSNTKLQVSILLREHNVVSEEKVKSYILLIPFLMFLTYMIFFDNSKNNLQKK